MTAGPVWPTPPPEPAPALARCVPCNVLMALEGVTAGIMAAHACRDQRSAGHLTSLREVLMIAWGMCHTLMPEHPTAPDPERHGGA